MSRPAPCPRARRGGNSFLRPVASASPQRLGHGADGGDRDLRRHLPARPPPHPGVPQLRRHLPLPPHRRGHRHLPQIGALRRAGAALTPTSPGTTWMQEILTLLFSRGDVLPAKTIPNWERAPWLEQIYFRQVLQDTAARRLITTHLPARVLGPALQHSKAKVIYVARNPKDVVVSFYHFHRLAKFLPDPGSFDTFLTRFLEGTVHYGSWFDHVKGWLGQRQLLDIFYVTYEELHQDLRGTAQRLSTFLGCPLGLETLGALEQHCSFATMRDNVMANYTLIPTEIMDHSQGSFMRKGVVGDWRDHFSPQQNALFNRLYQEEMGDLELPMCWPMA
ncbi:sulfotransferase 2B1 isoform X2 [Falco naumanni]|uniref:sulfotransferase 2B1 isoform X2 n=1 Tax=Falco naumanni TaxID=148594 RepID=UPI001ADEBE04|nr:sulfotransferase 2B1 isoform X2 [Falco naumanni]